SWRIRWRSTFWPASSRMATRCRWRPAVPNWYSKRRRDAVWAGGPIPECHGLVTSAHYDRGFGRRGVNMSDVNVLVVEDEDAIREMLGMVLEQADFAVQSASDAHQALALMNQTEPDLILLDWMLPGLSGVEWARRLKKDESYSEIPIILLTARGEEEDRVRGFEVGADDYVTKPFSTRELIARIKAVLRRSGR